MQMRSKTSQPRASKKKTLRDTARLSDLCEPSYSYIYTCVYIHTPCLYYNIIYKIIINYDTPRLLHLSSSRRDSLLLLNAARAQSVTVYNI